MSILLAFALVVAAPAWGAAEAPYQPDEHTVLLLPFDEGRGETATDSSVSGLDAAMMGAPRAPKWEPDGMFGACLRFDGVNADEDGDGRGDADALVFRDQGQLGAADGLTVEAWIHPERVDTNQGIIARAGGARWCFYIYGDTLYFSMQMKSEGDPLWQRARSGHVIRTNEWQHVAAVYDGETIRLFVNARQVAEEPATGEPMAGPSLSVIGCDTDSRPIDSAIRGFRGMMDEVRVSNVARVDFAVSEERTAAVAEAPAPAPTSGLPDRPRYPDPPVPPTIERQVTVIGRVRDEAGAPLAGVPVSDGEHVVLTDAEGGYRLQFDLKGLRFVFATRPRGYRPVAGWYLAIPQEEAATEYAHDFVFTADSPADRESFSFLTCGDTQFNDVGTFVHLLAEYDQLTQMSGDPGFFTIAGDLTLFGSQWEMDMYRDVAARSHLDVYNCFGGHDGNYARETLGRGSIYNYQRNLGPASYSWDYGPVHFITYVSETSFLTERELELQTAWIEADLDAQPEGRPIVIETHIPPANAQMQAWLDRHNIVGVIYGHWHLVNVCGYGGVPYVDTGPMRGRDWGAFSRNFRVVRYADGKIETEVRICGQVQRLDIIAPQGTLGRGVVPVEVKAYDTVRYVTGAACQIEAGGIVAEVPLTRTGYHTWAGTWDAGNAPVGEITIRATATDEDGRAWEATATADLLDAPASAVRAGDDWPGFFRSAHSRVREQPLGSALALAWRVNTGGRCQKAVSPIIYSGRLYVGVDAKEVGHPGAGVSCYDPANGRLIWHTDTDASVCFAPAAADGTVYAVSSLGTCYALDAETGAERWHSQPFGEPSSHRLVQCCPVVVGDELVVIGDSGVCRVLSRTTGEAVRGMDFGGSLIHFSFPSVREGRIYAGIRKLAVAHDLASGQQMWQTDISTGKISSTPVPHDGRLYINAARLSCLDETGGEPLWERAVSTSGNGISVAVPVGDVVLANGTSLHAFDAATGEPRWVHDFPYDAEMAQRNQRQTWAGQSSPAVAGDVAFVGHDDGRLYAFALDDGEVLWRYHLGVPIKGSPIVSGNALWVCDWDGNLYCFAAR